MVRDPYSKSSISYLILGLVIPQVSLVRKLPGHIGVLWLGWLVTSIHSYIDLLILRLVVPQHSESLCLPVSAADVRAKLHWLSAYLARWNCGVFRSWIPIQELHPSARRWERGKWFFSCLSNWKGISSKETTLASDRAPSETSGHQIF